MVIDDAAWPARAEMMVRFPSDFIDAEFQQALIAGYEGLYPTFLIIAIIDIFDTRGMGGYYIKNALMTAAQRNNYELMRWFLEVKKLDPNGTPDGYLPLFFADYDGMQILLEAGANPNAKPSVLRYYVGTIARHDPSIILLLRHGANPYRKEVDFKKTTMEMAYSDRCRSMLERAWMVPILLSPRMVPRIGPQSALQMLPVEIVRLVARCLCVCLPHTQ